MWALVQGGVVAETTEEDPTGKYHPSLIWREAPAGTPIGARYAGGHLAVAELVSGYPHGEQMTWDVQRVEAMAWAADPATPTPYLDGLAKARGITAEDMRARTLAQTQAFLAASQQLVGKRQKLADRIAAAKTPAEVAKIVW
jgi:hypothetical protein